MGPLEGFIAGPPCQSLIKTGKGRNGPTSSSTYDLNVNNFERELTLLEILQPADLPVGLGS